MNKKKLISAISRRTGSTISVVTKNLDAMIDIIKETTNDKQEVYISNFCKFKIVRQKEKIVRVNNFREEMVMPERDVVKVKLMFKIDEDTQP